MVYVRHAKKSIDEIKKLRATGLTIEELMLKFNMPKTTIWHHIKDVPLEESVKSLLLSRKGGSRKRKLLKIKSAELKAVSLLHSTDVEYIKLVAMLYWAEGHKKHFIFTNTDSDMLLMYVLFLRNVLKICTYDINVLIRIADPIKPSESLKFWSARLSLPETCFKISHDNIQNKTKTRFGICRIMVSKSSDYHKLMQALIKEVREEAVSSYSSMDRTPHS